MRKEGPARTIVKVKSETLWETAASSSANEGLLRLAYTCAMQAKNENMLTLLAKNPNLPADLGDELDNQANARIITARLAAGKVSAQLAKSAASDPRITIRAEAAKTPGLGDENYETILKGKLNTKICKNLMDNTSASAHTRTEAAVLSCYLPYGSLEGSAIGWEVKKRAKALLVRKPEAISRALASATPSGIAGEICSLEGVNLEDVERLVAVALDGVEAAGKVPDPWSGGAAFWEGKSFILIVARYKGLSDETIKRCHEAFAKAGPRWSLELYHAASMQLERETGGDENQRMRGLIDSCLNLEDTLTVTVREDLDDDEFMRLMEETNNIWEHSPRRIADEGAVKEAFKAANGNPLRVAVLCARLLDEQLDTDVIRATGLSEVIAAGYKHQRPGWKSELFKPEWWLTLVAAEELQDKVAEAIPTKWGWPGATPRTWLPDAERNRASRAFCVKAAEWTYAHLGENKAAWDALAQVGVKMDTNMLDAIHASLEIVSVAPEEKK